MTLNPDNQIIRANFSFHGIAKIELCSYSILSTCQVATLRYHLNDERYIEIGHFADFDSAGLENILKLPRSNDYVSSR